MKKTVGSMFRKIGSFLTIILALLASVVAIGIIVLLAYLLYQFFACSPRVSDNDKIEMMKEVIVALISVGGFCITVFLLITDKRKKKIEHYLGQICAYSIEEHLMLDEINRLKQERGLKQSRLQDFREQARNDDKNYLNQYPSMTSHRATELATRNAL